MKEDIKTVEIMVSEVTPFAGYPFRIIEDDSMHSLVESILRKGIQTPLEVRQLENQYEIIDGHRRFFAIKQIGLDYIPAIVRNLHDDEATIAFVDANLSKDLLISEQAVLYSMRYDAMHQLAERTGKRPMKKGKKQALDFVPLPMLLKRFVYVSPQHRPRSENHRCQSSALVELIDCVAPKQ